MKNIPTSATVFVSTAVIKQLCCRAMEQAQADSRVCCNKIFTAAEMKEIEKRRRVFSKRRFL